MDAASPVAASSTSVLALLAEASGFGMESLFPVLGMKQEIAVLASAAFAVISVVVNLWGGVITEKKRAELQLELERDRVFQQQLQEIQSVIARYRGPLLESGIDLEQQLWHLVSDSCTESRSAEECAEDIRYLLFTLAQFLGFVEVVRREGPRERPFLQASNPQGSDTLSTLVEAIRFVLTASPARLEEWYSEGRGRTHPGDRRRRRREDIIQEHMAQDGCSFSAGEDMMRVSRGAQRAIGTYMITTPMERHYTASYGDFHSRLESEPSFQIWFQTLQADALDLATGPPWKGEGPFPFNRWTRILLLQQLLVELFDLLDPDTVRMPMTRRVRLTPIPWQPLPRLSEYQRRLQDLSRATEFNKHNAALEGLRDLMRARSLEEPNFWVSQARDMADRWQQGSRAAEPQAKLQGRAGTAVAAAGSAVASTNGRGTVDAPHGGSMDM